MRKIFTTAALLLSGLVSMAQTQFVTPTSYRGAFAPAPTAMWTNGWCNWDPQNIDYVGTATPVSITANITNNTTWTSNNIYLLSGQIYVKNGATLTIQPGTVILGDYNTTGSGLFITQGSKLNAIGTASSPIVFTSSQPAGSKVTGDWGGIILLGRASNNSTGGISNVEGLAPTADTQFGGGTSPDDNDNSGTLQYVRIEYPGYVYQPNKEINGLTLGAVGRGTTIDHIQVSFSNDDAYEWFGGSVNCKYLVSYRNLDDDFDTDNGYNGVVQFGLSVRDPQVSDNPTVSTSEGFESDNDASGTTATPQTKAIFTNMTLIGPFRGNTANTIASGYRRGARIRRNSALNIFNSIFMDHQRGIHIDGGLSEANATNNILKFKNNLVAGNSAGKVCERNAGSTFDIWTWFGASNNDSLVSTSGILTTPYNYTSPDYRPATSSPALSNANFTDGAFTGIILCNLSSPTISGNTSICSGNSTTLTAPAGLTYNWGANGTSQSITVSTAGTFTVTVTDIYGCTATNSATTVLHTNPIAAITGNTNVCFGQSTTLSANTGFYTYSWTGGAITQSISANAAGQYILTLTDVNGCSDKDTVDIVVNALPSSVISGNANICAGETASLSVPSVIGNTYSWSNSTSSNTLTTSAAGTYTVTVTSPENCIATNSVTVVVNNLPTVTITGAASVCEGSSLNLVASGTASVLWENGFTTASLSVTPTTDSTISVIGTDANGCTDTDSFTITVNSIPSLTTAPTITPSNCGQSTGSIIGTVISGNGTLSYDWTDATNTNVGNTADLSSLSAGVYNLNVADANGCSKSFGPYSISNPGAPLAPVITVDDSTVCVGTAINLSATTIGTGVNYVWTGPAFSSNNASVTLSSTTTANSGVYAVTASMNNCISNATLVHITVSALPSVNLAASSNSVCINGSAVTLIGLPTGGVYSGTGVTANQFTPSTAGAQTMTYNFTDANGCANSATTSITVNALPTLTFTSSVNSICINSTSNVTLTGLPAGGTYSGNGVSGSTFFPTIAGAGASTLTYAFTDNNGCGNTTTHSVTVNTAPVVTLTAATTQACINHTTLALTGLPAGGTYSGSTAITGSNFDPSVAGIGNDTIKYMFTNTSGCSNSAQVVINVSPCTGIIEAAAQNANSVSVYPNPTSDLATLELILAENENVTAFVFDMTGKLVIELAQNKFMNAGSNKMNFDASSLDNGIYCIVIKAGVYNKTMKMVVSK